MNGVFEVDIMLNNIKPLYLHCVFHGIRFKVNNEDWLSVMDSLFFVYSLSVFISVEKTYLCTPVKRKCFK